MTAKELIEKLQNLPNQNVQIVMLEQDDVGIYTGGGKMENHTRYVPAKGIIIISDKSVEIY